jgi:ParB family transcriptional regulator, chromosome partitioning protein
MAKKKNIFSNEAVKNRKVKLPEQDDMIKERVKHANDDLGIKENIVALDPNELDTWIIRDRADFELGDIEALAISIKNKGQAQPIVVVHKSEVFKPKNNEDARYIVIAGYRRWKACVSHNIKIDTVIKKLTFDQAVACLEAENEKENVSEYSKGLFYFKLKEDYGYSLDKLSKKLGIAVSKLNRYISFAKVPNKLWLKVDDLSNVSSRTSAEILEMINSDSQALEFFLSITDKIANGYGHTRLRKLYEDNKKNINDKKEVCLDVVKVTTRDIKISFSKLNISNENREILIDKINNIVDAYK